MGEAIQIGRWVLRADVERTMDAHAKLIKSGAAECGCSHCRNFEAVRPKLLEGPLGVVLAQLGISPPWEVEVYQLYRLPSGLHEYGGWFHFVGTIESGSGAWRPIGGESSARTADFEPLSPTVSIGFHTDVNLNRNKQEWDTIGATAAVARPSGRASTFKETPSLS